MFSFRGGEDNHISYVQTEISCLDFRSRNLAAKIHMMS